MLWKQLNKEIYFWAQLWNGRYSVQSVGGTVLPFNAHLKDQYTWDCHVFVLESKAANHTLPKSNPKARVGVYLGHSSTLTRIIDCGHASVVDSVVMNDLECNPVLEVPKQWLLVWYNCFVVKICVVQAQSESKRFSREDYEDTFGSSLLVPNGLLYGVFMVYAHFIGDSSSLFQKAFYHL